MRQKRPQSDSSPDNIGTTSFEKKLLVAIILSATALRLASALYQGNSVESLPGIYDQISYDALAQRVVAGYGFSFAEGHWPATPAGEPTAHWSYLYTLYLAGVYALFGVNPIVARLFQAVIAGILQPYLAWRLGRRLFGPTAGLIAAALSAVYIYFFYYAGGLLTETFYLVGILWTFEVALRLTANDRPSGAAKKWPGPGGWLWLELGLAIGLTALLRQVFLLFAPFLYLWLWWTLSQRVASTHRLTWSRLFCWPVLAGLLGATVIVAMLITPWTMRNYRVFATFVPLNTNAGFAFYWGNHPIHGTRFIPLLPVDGPSYSDLIPPELRQLNEAELDRALLRESMKIITADPTRFVLLSVTRTVEYFKFWPVAESGLVSNISRVGSFGLALPFMLYGLWLAARRLGRADGQPQQPAEIILLLLFVVIYTGIHLLTWTLIRYRLPVDAILLIFAALGLEDLTRRYLLGAGSFLKYPGLHNVRPGR
jgi:hypothetical protein